MKTKLSGLLAGLCLLGFTASAEPELPGEELTAPLFEASFLQGWYCRDWNEAQWQSELSDMRSAGFRAVILQSAVDLNYEQTDFSQPKTDADAYALTSAYALYPTALVSGSEHAHALEYALNAASKTGMLLYIGTVSDSRWWNYGWGVPDSFFSGWAEENAAQCAAVIAEVWSQYGAQYSEQIAGFYYNNEIWNMDAACTGDALAAYAEILGGNLRGSLEQLALLCPEKPLLISPFYNKDLSSAAQYADFWRAVAEQAQFRPQDIFACQDGGGRDYDTETLHEWNTALQAALGGRMRFWVNNEAFRADNSVRDAAQLRESYLATADAEKHILFSWNHHYHGKLDAEYAAFLRQMTGDINGDGACSLADAVLLRRWLLGEAVCPANWLAGDLDANGVWNAADLTLLKRMLLLTGHTESCP